MSMVEWQMEPIVNIHKNSNKFQSSIKQVASPATMQVRYLTFPRLPLKPILTLKVNLTLNQVQIKVINMINSSKW